MKRIRLKKLSSVLTSDLEFNINFRLKRDLRKHIVKCVTVIPGFIDVSHNISDVVFRAVNRFGEFYISAVIKDKCKHRNLYSW